MRAFVRRVPRRGNAGKTTAWPRCANSRAAGEAPHLVGAAGHPGGSRRRLDAMHEARGLLEEGRVYSMGVGGSCSTHNPWPVDPHPRGVGRLGAGAGWHRRRSATSGSRASARRARAEAGRVKGLSRRRRARRLCAFDVSTVDTAGGPGTCNEPQQDRTGSRGRTLGHQVVPTSRTHDLP